jgi:5-carboxymethyl-2-hydroxymuconate isomerase
MPHIFVEYSTNIEPRVDAGKLIRDLHRTVVETGIAEPRMVRTRALPRERYVIADGDPRNVFVHVVARIRAGRSEEARKNLGDSLLRCVKDTLAPLSDSTPMAISVEVQELDPETLFRHITVK